MTEAIYLRISLGLILQSNKNPHWEWGRSESLMVVGTSTAGEWTGSRGRLCGLKAAARVYSPGD